jgi:hypothetical protein
MKSADFVKYSVRNSKYNYVKWKKKSNSNEKEKLKNSIVSKNKQFELYDESRNVVYFNYD